MRFPRFPGEAPAWTALLRLPSDGAAPRTPRGRSRGPKAPLRARGARIVARLSQPAWLLPRRALPAERLARKPIRAVFWLLPFLMLLAGSALAQGPTYGVGRTPSAEEIRAWDISISPTGEELPPGRGTAEEGALVYRRKGCAGCHGRTGTDGRAPRLVKREAEPSVDPWNLGRILPIRAPYATVVWDYINRGMPLNREGTLTADEVYALTAYLLYLNDLIPEDKVMDAQSLPKIEMPNRDAWAPLPDWKPGMPRLPGYPH